MKIPLRMLHIEDNEDDAELILRTIDRGGCEIVQYTRIQSEAEMRSQLESRTWDLILSDYNLPNFDASQALAVLTQHQVERCLDIPFIVISGVIGEETAVAMMKAGAADYLLKDRLTRLAPAIVRELRELEGRRERFRIQTALHEHQERLAKIVEVAIDAIISVDEEQRIVEFNPAAEDTFGWKKEEIICQPLEVLLPEASRLAHFRLIREFGESVLSNQHMGDGLFARHRNGESFPIEATISKTTVNGKKLFTAILRDITERKRAEAQLREGEYRHRKFLRDVLFGATEGRLRLCDDREELPPLISEPEATIPLSAATLARLRSHVQKFTEQLDFPEERSIALISAASEAGMNAVVHAGGGRAWCAASDTGTIQIRVEDFGTGISLDNLPRATLERGFTTAGTMGFGFSIILQSCDRICLLTSPEGTVIVMEMDKEVPLPPWLTSFS